MGRQLVPLIVALVALGPWAPAAAPPGYGAATSAVYLPLVAAQGPVEVVVTAAGVDCPECYPSYSYVCGYLRARPGAPAGAAELAVGITVYPYAPPGVPNPGPRTETVRFTPALPATLEGQPNPFAYVVANGKGFTAVGADVRVAGFTPAAPEARHHPLTVAGWSRAGDKVTAEVRNDSPETLRGLRAGALVGGSCGWRAAALAASALRPGESLTFTVDFVSPTADVQILGQGVAP